MAQGSKPRHSRSTRKPVTIDLEPEAVSTKKLIRNQQLLEKRHCKRRRFRIDSDGQQTSRSNHR